MNDEPGIDGMNDHARRLCEEAAHLYGVTKRRKEALRTAQEQSQAVTGEAASADGSVRATVDAGGMLTELGLAAEALLAGPRELARLVTAVTQQAAADARAQVRHTYERLRNEGIVRGIPALLPEPTSAEVRNRPAPPEEEPSYEERSITRRRGRS